MSRRIQSALTLLAGLLTAGAVLAPAGASAQVNIDQDKTPAHIYASDCSVCHKSIRGLANGKGHAALTAFLAEHYTSSDSEASALAAYVLANGGGVGTAAPARDALLGSKRGQAAAEDSDHREAGAAKPKSKPTTSAKPEWRAGAGRKTEAEARTDETHKPGEKRTASEKQKAKVARQHNALKKRTTEVKPKPKQESKPKAERTAVEESSRPGSSRELPTVRHEPKTETPRAQPKHEASALPAHEAGPVAAVTAPASSAGPAATHAPGAGDLVPVKPSGAAPPGDNIPD